MSVTVTIHEGELKQIKSLIDKEEKAGQLYGLWTHSNQPVIQYVIGDPKPNESEHIKKCLEENHGLRHIGNWSAADRGGDKFNPESPCFVKMTVKLSSDKETLEVKLCVSQKRKEHKNSLDGVIETLKGESAFRSKSGPFPTGSPLAVYHKNVVSTRLKVDCPNPRTANEAKTKKEQWYSTEEGMQLFGKIHGALQNYFQITGTSRDTNTHDISLNLSHHRRELTVDFPLNFPHEMAVLTEGRRKMKISLKETESKPQGRSGKNPQQPQTSPKVNQADNSKNGQKKGSQTEVVPVKGDESASGDASMQNEDVSQEPLDPEKVPELLVQGICHVAKIHLGSSV